MVIAAAGDIACDPARSDFNAAPGTSTCQMGVTAGQVSALSPDGVLALGDNQYECGPLSAFNAGYANSWGAFKSITYPVPGNHEYGNTTLQQPFTPCDSPPQSGYFNYFGARAGDPSKGYYSFDLGAWHLVALNSECGSVGGCGPGSAQETWLTSDLASHPAACTLAFWHDPRFASGGPGNDAEMATFWSDLQAAGADVVLDGHFHVYERFAGQDSSGHATPLGLRQFTVGTGGRSLAAFGSVAANSEVRLNQSFGILKMTLRPTGYDWQFMPTTSSQGDAGSDTCH